MSYRHMNYEPAEFCLTPQTRRTDLILSFPCLHILACPLLAIIPNNTSPRVQAFLPGKFLGTAALLTQGELLVNTHDKKFLTEKEEN